MTDGRTEVFCLTGPEGRILPPSVQATVLAKYSRSPLSARDLLKQLTEEEADKFQSKWVVGFGHSSVSELASIPVCFEGVSIVASKMIESWQRGGYSEKSTRYQVFSKDSFVTPPGAPDTMKKFASRFYEAYERLNVKVVRRVAELVGDNPDNPKRTTTARAFDNVRYLLPAGTGTNVAAVLNLRDVRDMISVMRGHANPEFAKLGDAVHDAAIELAPALIKHTDPNSFELPIKSLGFVQGIGTGNLEPSVKVHRPHLMPDPKLEQASFESLVADVHGMSWSTFCKHMETRPAYSEVPKVFKSIKVSFEIMMDYGAYRDLQRHRRCEQIAEPLHTNYGYVVPDDILGSDLELEYRAAMDSINSYGDENVLHDVELMQYMVPLGYLHRSMFQMDLRELYYIVELRTKPQGHISYRRIAYQMYELVKERWPQLLQWCRAVKPEGIGEHH